MALYKLQFWCLTEVLEIRKNPTILIMVEIFQFCVSQFHKEFQFYLKKNPADKT